MMKGGSFDISQPVRETTGPFLRQFMISRDFVERKEDCSVQRLALGGGMSLSESWVDEVAAGAGLPAEPWNPLKGLSIANGAVPGEYAGHEPRWAAALGACLGVLEEET
jgi:hypothetical protein